MNGILVSRKILLGRATMTANGTLKFGRVLLVVMTFLGVFRWECLPGRLRADKATFWHGLQYQW